jgi:hypothetical protein
MRRHLVRRIQSRPLQVDSCAFRSSPTITCSRTTRRNNVDHHYNDDSIARPASSRRGTAGWACATSTALMLIGCSATSSIDGLPHDVNFEVEATVLNDGPLVADPRVVFFDGEIDCDAMLARGEVVSTDLSAITRSVVVYLRRAIEAEDTTSTWTEPLQSAVEVPAPDGRVESAESGELRLEIYRPGEQAVGRFVALFRGSKIAGSFDAHWCCSATPGAQCVR